MNLNEEDIKKCQKVFSELDDDGQGAILCNDLGLALEMLGFVLTEQELYKIVYEIDDTNTGYIPFSKFLEIYQKLQLRDADEDDQDTIDAFIACGGNEDKSGNVDAEVLIDIIKNQFNLTIDIEKLIKEIDADGSGEIEFDEFKTLLQTSQNQAE